MITKRIKALFQFIEFLHINKEKFIGYYDVINELHMLSEKRNKLKPNDNYADKLKYDKVQRQIKEKFSIIEQEIIDPIKDKVNELDICDWNNFREGLWNRNIDEISKIKSDFNESDVSEIMKYKRKYLDFRNTIKSNFFQNLFFNDLDKILKELFDFFKDSNENEFASFEKKTIEVNSITELAINISQIKNPELTESTNTTLPSQHTDKQKLELSETKLPEKIKKHFGFFQGNCPRKHKQILKNEDFNKLIEWTIYYYENKFKLPEISEPIKVVNTNKTFVQLAFKYLFKELNKSSTYPPSLFEFYKSAFSPYSEDKKHNFEAVKHNDEVKKLMQIN